MKEASLAERANPLRERVRYLNRHGARLQVRWCKWPWPEELPLMLVGHTSWGCSVKIKGTPEVILNLIRFGY